MKIDASADVLVSKKSLSLQLDFFRYKIVPAMDHLIRQVEEQLLQTDHIPDFRPGDTVEVSYKIVEGNKERIQKFKGVVLKIEGEGKRKTFTVRKMSGNIGVERIFPFACPNVVEVKVTKYGKVRRAKLYYLRGRVGKKARIKERQVFKKSDNSSQKA